MTHEKLSFPLEVQRISQSKDLHHQRDSKYINSPHLTSTILYSALLDEKSRSIWEAHAKKKEYGRNSALSIRAIARSMSAYENSTYGLKFSPQKYKDRVSRALSSGRISIDTLDLMCKTFAFPPETVRSLHQAVMHGFDASETLQIVRTIAQVMVSSSYFDLRICSDVRSPGKFELKVTLTLLSLEAGCSVVLFPFRHVEDIVCESDQFHVAPASDPGEWLFVSDTFIPPQETFMLRFSMSGQAPISSDGFYVLESPFVYRVFSTGIKVSTNGQEREVRLEELSSTLSPRKLLAAGRTNDYVSCFCPVIDSSTIHIKWK